MRLPWWRKPKHKPLTREDFEKIHAEVAALPKKDQEYVLSHFRLHGMGHLPTFEEYYQRFPGGKL